MSTLQVSLAIIGGFVLAGVVAYNAWITRRNLPRTVRDRGADPAERLPGDPPVASTSPETAPGADEHGRIEPVLDDDMPTRPDDLGGLDDLDRAPAVPPPPGYASVAFNPMVAAPEKRPALDALIDVIAPLALENEVSGDAVLAASPGTRRVGSKPFAVEGQSAASGEWETPRLGLRYRALQAGVQLANRAGALNDIEFSEFVVKAQAFADTLGAAPDFPDMRAEVARARELDAFASGHDAQLGFTLRARRAAWSPGYVTQHAARQGFVAGTAARQHHAPGQRCRAGAFAQPGIRSACRHGRRSGAKCAARIGLVAGGHACTARRAAVCAYAPGCRGAGRSDGRRGHRRRRSSAVGRSAGSDWCRSGRPVRRARWPRPVGGFAAGAKAVQLTPAELNHPRVAPAVRHSLKGAMPAARQSRFHGIPE
jgi:hypothetical protein